MKRRWIVNVFWRECGYPRLPLTETWCCLMASDDERISTARRLVAETRRLVAGLYGVRVLFSLDPVQEVGA